MALADKIRSDLTVAIKARESVRVSTLRMLLAAFKNTEISKRSPLTDDDGMAQIQKAIKMRREAIAGAIKAGRDDLRENEESELKILEVYLPAQLSEEDLAGLIAATIEEVGAKGPGDMGKVMKILIPRTAGKADSSVTSRLVRQKLSS